jgi:biotin carboxyl carrier protein
MEGVLLNERIIIFKEKYFLMPEKFRATVNGAYEFELSETSPASLDMVRTGKHTGHVLAENRSHRITLEHADFDARKYTLWVDDQKFEVDLAGTLDLEIEKMGFDLAAGTEITRVEAPMPGLLLEIYVEAGQEVDKDQPLLVLEAMKMENVILSPRKGIIAGILQSKGVSVEKGMELIAFD